MPLTNQTYFNRLIFKVIPTILVGTFLMWLSSKHIAILGNDYWQLAFFFGLGCTLSSFFFHNKWRFVPITIILLILLSLGNSAINSLDIGDADYFRWAHQFRIFATLFVFGWVVVHLLIRYRWGAYLVSIAFLLIVIFSIVRDTSLFNDQFRNWMKWLQYFVPVLLYSWYIIFMAQQLIQRRADASLHKVSFTRLLVKSSIMLGIFLLLVLFTIFIEKSSITNQLKQYKEGGKGGKQSSMMKETGDGFKLNDKNSLSGSNKKNKQLLFAAYIDNFFPNSEYPNPLYLTSFYYSRFDSATETFIKVDDMPDRDLFEPNPSKIPLYSTVIDSSVLAFGKDNKYQKTVEIEVYNKALSPSEFCAPTTSYMIQPIAVSPEYRSEYKAAYRATSRVSEWNSAYFVYNVDHPEAKAWQALRHRQLQQVKDFSDMPQDVYDYYTHLPVVTSLDSVRVLAKSLVRADASPIDKVMAIKDFFTAVDSNGKKIFSYSDNPGIPDLPSASKLNYFLFQNKKGYCAYYAGATLFMLRSLGIPSRITVGFLTQDRSNQNKGWYYYYADQSHAWVQIYFPGYGWIDFDTTVGNDDARQSEQPDGTPPLQPSKATLIINGVISSVDVRSKKIMLTTQQVGVGDKPTDTITASVTLDVAQSKISLDTMLIPIDSLKVRDTITALSFDRKWSESSYAARTIKSWTQNLPNGIAVEQVLKRRVVEPVTLKPDNKADDHSKSWQYLLWIGLGALFLIGLLLLPYWLYHYYISKAKRGTLEDRAHYAHKAVQYYHHMMSPLSSYASTTDFAKMIDQQYASNYAQFIRHYLKIKYNKAAYHETSYHEVSNIPFATIDTIATQYKNHQKWLRWMNVAKCVTFLIKRRKYEAA